MHVIERYALSTGAKIDKPEVWQDYFPLPFEKFVVFAPEGKEHKRYLFWQEVLNLLMPIFESKNIKVIQVGSNQKTIPYSGVMSICGQTTLNTLSFVLDKSLLYLGVDSFLTQIASSLDKKVVAVYSHVNIQNRKPFWGKAENQILIEPSREKGHKPSFGMPEKMDYLNKIGPEQIAAAVCKALKLEFTYPYKTIYTGDNYGTISVDVEPRRGTTLEDYEITAKVSSISIRMDWNHDEKGLLEILNQINAKCTIVTSKQIPLNMLKSYSGKIESVTFIYDGNNINQITEQYVKSLDIFDIKFALVSHEEDEKVNNQLKLKCMDFSFLNIEPHSKKPKHIEERKGQKLYFKSNKRILANRKIYNCYYNYLNDIPQDVFGRVAHSEVIDHPDFWREVESYNILEK